jgi:hypothetical protein
MPPAQMNRIEAIIAKLGNIDDGMLASGQLHLERE